MINCVLPMMDTFIRVPSWSYGSWFYNISMKSVPITINIESSNPNGEVWSIQHYVIKFVSDLQQVSGFLRVTQFSPPIKLTASIKLNYC